MQKPLGFCNFNVSDVQKHIGFCASESFDAHKPLKMDFLAIESAKPIQFFNIKIFDAKKKPENGKFAKRKLIPLERNRGVC